MLRTPWFDAWDDEDAPATLGTPLQRMLIAPAFRRIVGAGMTELMCVAGGQIVGQINERKRVRDVMFDLQREYLDAMARLNAINPEA